MDSPGDGQGRDSTVMNVIQEIKQRADLVSLVSEYVRLEKAGRYFKGLCPFHTEKVPSFFVFPERQSWRCFGCGASGDIFSFVMRKEGIDFKAALELLAQRVGIQLPRKKAARESWERLYEINEAAAQYYHRLLLTSPAGEPAREYLRRRGVGKEAIKAFQLGYSPDAWEGVKLYLGGRGYASDELLCAGLLVEKEGRVFDRFRGKLMFPIRDEKGRVIGFGARTLKDEELPKYVNSPQTPIFDKGSVLYGIDRAIDAIRAQKKAVIVEGYMDVIAAHEHGMRWVVGSMGTSLTQRQLLGLKNLASSLYLALDPDVAGDIATLRSIELCRQVFSREVCSLPNLLGTTSRVEVEIKIVSLPRGKDPDKLIRENPDEFARLLKAALPLIEHAFKVAGDKFDLSSPRGKSQAAESLLPLIAELGEVEQELYLSRLSKLLGLSERTLLGLARRLKSTAAEQAPRGGEVPTRTVSLGDTLEEYFLYLLLRYPELRERVKELPPEEFERSENREVFSAWKRNPELEAIRESLPPELQEHLDGLLNRNAPELQGEELEKAFSSCLRRLEERKLRARLIFEAEAALEGGEDPRRSAEKIASLQRRLAALGSGG